MNGKVGKVLCLNLLVQCEVIYYHILLMCERKGCDSEEIVLDRKSDICFP